MLEILSASISMLLGLLLSLWSVLSVLGVWVYEVLYHLHVSAPRLEGLLVGVTLTWLLLRRDKHPLLRVLSAPLKLVLDVLDLAWDQCVEVLQDLLGTVQSWISGVLSWCKSRVVSVYDSCLNSLKVLKGKLSK